VCLEQCAGRQPSVVWPAARVLQRQQQ
jgi:hypothetical protein